MTARRTARKILYLVLGGAAFLPVCSRAAADADQFNFAEALFIQNDFESAAEEYRGLLDGFPDSDRCAAARFRIGECFLRRKAYDRAAAAFRQALKLHPRAQEAAFGHYNLGRCLLETSHFAAAETAFAAAAKADSTHVREEAMVGRGECLIKLNRLQDAVTLYREFLRVFPKSEHRKDIMFSLAWALATLGNHEQAVTAYGAVIKAFPEPATADLARLALADSLTSLGRFAASATLLKQLLDRGVQTEPAALRLAWNAFKSGDKARAAELFTAYADRYKARPMAVTALYNAGIARYETQRYAEAVAVFRRIQKEYADRAEARDLRFWLGLSLFELGESAEAADVLDALLAADEIPAGKRGSLIYTLGEARAASGDDAAAAALFKRLLKEEPTSTYVPNALYSLATSLERAGALPEATSTLQRLLAEHPGTELRKHALFALSEYLYRQKQPAAALPHLEELNQGPAPPAKAAYRLGWVYFDLGRFADSEKTFLALAARDTPFAHEALFLAGQAADRQKAAERAAAHYRRLIAVEANDEWVEKGYLQLGLRAAPAAQDAHYAAYLARFPNGACKRQLKLHMAEACFAAEQYETAVGHYWDLLRTAAGRTAAAPVQYGLGWALLKLDRLAEADVAFAAAATDAPEPDMRADATLQRGEIAYRQKRYAAAAAWFDKVRGAAGTRGERALYMLAWSHRQMKDATGALAGFRALLARFPDGIYHVDARLRCAEGLQRAGDPAAAREILTPALRALDAPLREDVLHRYADILVALKDWRALLGTCDTLLQEWPASERRFLVSFRRGLAYKALGLYDKAEAAFRETIARTETVEAAQAQFNIGTLYMSRKDYVAAAKQFLRVEMLYDYDDLSPRALYHAVEAFVKAGPKSAARAQIYARKLQEKYGATPWAKRAAELLTEEAKKP